MTLQSKSKIICITRLVLASMLLAVAWISASAQTNTFPASGNAGVGTTTPTIQSGVSNTMVEVKGTVNPGVGLTSTAAGGRQYFVYSSQANPGYFSVFDATAGADRFVIGSSGNVGIGTAAPSEILHVGGGFISTIRNEMSTWLSQNVAGGETDLSNNAYYSSGWKYRLTDEASQIQQLNGDIRFFTAASGTADSGVTFSEKLTVLQGGNIGIGTNAPTQKLEVAGTGLFKGTTLTGPTGAGLYILDQNIVSLNGVNARDLSVQAQNLKFFTGTTYAEKMRIDLNGNVGIGNVNPIYKLDVNGEINATGLRINGTPISGGGGSQWTGTSSIYYNGGNVGIGTTNPDKKLVVIDGPSLYLKFLRSSNDGLYMYADGNYYGLNAYDFTSQVYKPMSIGWGQQNLYLARDGGNVGIGTTTPQSNLQIGSQTGGQTGTPVTLSLGGSFSNSAGANFKLKLYDDGVSSNTYGIGVSLGNMDFGVNSGAGYKWYAGGANKMTLNSNGDLSVSGSIAAKYQDLAEWVPSSEQLSAGTVVVLDTTKSNQVVSATVAYDTRVAGVISAQPGITLGESGEGKVLVATTGRVRVKVDASRGAIQIGDLLVTSDVPGVAMKSEPVEFAGRKMHMPGTIIGKALEPLAKGTGEILVLLSLQ
jgi:hypothetical protein